MALSPMWFAPREPVAERIPGQALSAETKKLGAGEATWLVECLLSIYQILGSVSCVMYNRMW